MSNSRTASKGGNKLTIAIWAIGIVLVVVIFLILAKTVSKPSPADTGGAISAASAELMTKVTGIPQSVSDQIGQGTSTPLPKPIDGPPLTSGGKPQVFYSGAEYCPYCAAERWPMVITLSRFGTFAGINTTHSATGDVFPNTQTFSFHGAKYSSDYIAFRGLEMQSNQLQGNSYAQLDTPTAAEQTLIKVYDAPPYVAKESAGAIPFIDFGGKYVISGSTYSPSVLAGKSPMEIASALSDPNSPIAQGAVGSANAMTAAICSLTGNQPANVCGSDMIKSLQAKIASQ